VVYVFGYGFPAYRGGPMHYADTIGLQEVYRSISELHAQTGESYWQPAALLETLAKENTSFQEWSARS